MLAWLLACASSPGPAPWQLPSGEGALAPHLLAEPAGIRLTWFEPVGDGHALKTAVFAGGTWSEPAVVAANEPFFVNWADTPAVARACLPAKTG